MSGSPAFSTSFSVTDIAVRVWVEGTPRSRAVAIASACTARVCHVPHPSASTAAAPHANARARSVAPGMRCSSAQSANRPAASATMRVGKT